MYVTQEYLVETFKEEMGGGGRRERR